MIPVNVIHWAATECERDNSGEMSVFHMIEAWNFALSKKDMRITNYHLNRIASYVEPSVNRDAQLLLSPEESELIRWQPSLSQREFTGYPESCNHWYHEFMRCNPYLSGNKRIGVILYNWLMGTLYFPTAAPIR